MSQSGLVDILDAYPEIPTEFITDSGTAVPILNQLDILGDGGQGVSTSGSGNTVLITVADATTTTKGVAEFNPADFTVVSGVVSLTGAGFALTLTGDQGGAISPSSDNFNILSTATAGSSTSFSGSGSTLAFNTTDANLNTLIGQFAGNALIATPGGGNVSLGYNTLNKLTTGQFNVAVGSAALNSVETGSSNTAIGHGALAGSFLGTSISNNTAIGYSVGTLLRGDQNTLIGSFVGDQISTGSNNIAIGYDAASAYSSSESSNILIGNSGVVSESNTIRIGTQGSGAGLQDECFIAGIVGVATSNSQMVTIDSTSGQLGVATIPTGTVTSVSVVSANGFSGSVANDTTTPAITISTTATGVLSGNGTAISGSAVTQYAVLAGGASNAISSIGPGSVGQVLQSGGAGADPAYSTATYPSVATSSGTILRANGTNWLATTATYPNAASGSTATTPLVVNSSATGFEIKEDGGPAVTRSITLTNAQIKALNATPILVVPALIPGSVRRVLSCVATMNYGGTNVFTAGAGQTINLYYGLGVTNIGVVMTNAMIVAANKQIQGVNLPLAAAVTTYTSFNNQPIYLFNPVATEIAGNAANNNTMTFYVTYQTFFI